MKLLDQMNRIKKIKALIFKKNNWPTWTLKYKILWVLLVINGLIFSSCNSNTRNSDTPNQGEINMAADNTIEPIIAQELDIFGYDFPETKINCRFSPENEIFKRIMDDSIHFAVTTRRLSPDERSHFNNRKIEIYENKVATDAVAVIVNRMNPDTTLSLITLKEILEGKIQNWNSILVQSHLGEIRVILDQNGSSIERNIKEVLGSHALDSKKIFSLTGNAAVANYIAKNPNAIGFIGMNWLNNNDSASTNLASKVHVLALSQNFKAEENIRYYMPNFNNINFKKYPFIRSVFTLSVEGHTGLGTGFAVFLESDKGQLIFSKSGVLPKREVTREIHLN